MKFLESRTSRVVTALAMFGAFVIGAGVVARGTSESRQLALGEMATLLGGQMPPPPNCPGCMVTWNFNTCFAQDECTICQGSEWPTNPGACATYGTSYSNNPIPSGRNDYNGENMQKVSATNNTNTVCGYLDFDCNSPLPPAKPNLSCQQNFGQLGYDCTYSEDENALCRDCAPGTIMQNQPINVATSTCVPCGS